MQQAYSNGEGQISGMKKKQNAAVTLPMRQHLQGCILTR